MAAATAAPPVGDASSHRFVRRAALAAACLAGAGLYWPVLAGLVRQWYDDPNAAYGPLVAIAALISLRQRRPQLRSLEARGSNWGAMAVALAAALYVTATLAADVFVLRFSAVLFLVATLWFAAGTAYVRVLAAPLLLCAVIIPPPTALVTELTMPLQLAASRIAAATLGVLGLDVVRDGNVLTLSHITLEVAEACSGMRSIVTLLALVAVFWGTGGPRPSHALVLAAATIPVALAGNAMRVVATALLALRIGDDAVKGTVHDATGLAAFIAMCAALALIYVGTGRARRRGRDAGPHASRSPQKDAALPEPAA